MNSEKLRDYLVGSMNRVLDEFGRSFYAAIDALDVSHNKDNQGNDDIVLHDLVDKAAKNNPRFSEQKIASIKARSLDTSAIIQFLFGSKHWQIKKGNLHCILDYRNDLHHRKINKNLAEKFTIPSNAIKTTNCVINILELFSQHHSCSFVKEQLDWMTKGFELNKINKMEITQNNINSSRNFTMTKEQKECVSNIRDWLFGSSDKRYFVVSGKAGTGKTSVLANFLEESGLNPKNVLVATPTRKAREVLRKKLPERAGWRTRLRTIASVVWKYARPTYDGQDQIFKKIGKKSPATDRKLEGVTTLVVDEASMITKEEHEALTKYYRVVYFGDPDQLPPVIQEDSTDVPSGVLEKPDFVLNRIHRQSKDSPIIDVAARAKKGEQLEFFTVTEGVSWYNETSGDLDKNEFDKLLGEHDIIISGRNTTRIAANQKIRNIIGVTSYPGDTIPKPGEILIANQTLREVMGMRGINSGDRLVVLEFLGEVDIRSDNDSKEDSQRVLDYRLRVRIEGEESEQEAVIVVSSEMLGGTHVRGNKIVTRDISGPRSNVLRCDWGYAITVHKAQGSEWSKVLVLDDMIDNERIPKKNWNYVAYSRAIDKLTTIKLASKSRYL